MNYKKYLGALERSRRIYNPTPEEREADRAANAHYFRDCPECGAHGVVVIDWHWRDHDDPTAPCWRCSCLSGRRSKVDGDTTIREPEERSALESSPNEDIANAARMERKEDERFAIATELFCAPEQSIADFMRTRRQPSVPARDPLEVALEVARALSWWDAKVEAKAVVHPPHTWDYLLVEGDKARRKFLDRLLKVAAGSTVLSNEARLKKSEQEKARRAATREARMAEQEAKLADLKTRGAALEAALEAAKAAKDWPACEAAYNDLGLLGDEIRSVELSLRGLARAAAKAK